MASNNNESNSGRPFLPAFSERGLFAALLGAGCGVLFYTLALLIAGKLRGSEYDDSVLPSPGDLVVFVAWIVAVLSFVVGFSIWARRSRRFALLPWMVLAGSVVAGSAGLLSALAVPEVEGFFWRLDVGPVVLLATGIGGLVGSAVGFALRDLDTKGRLPLPWLAVSGSLLTGAGGYISAMTAIGILELLSPTSPFISYLPWFMGLGGGVGLAVWITRPTRPVSARRLVLTRGLLGGGVALLLFSAVVVVSLWSAPVRWNPVGGGKLPPPLSWQALVEAMVGALVYLIARGLPVFFWGATVGAVVAFVTRPYGLTVNPGKPLESQRCGTEIRS